MLRARAIVSLLGLLLWARGVLARTFRALFLEM